jgi:hypothetical protein
VIVAWNQRTFDQLWPRLGPTPMLGFDTGEDAITPEGIARGAGDGFLLAMSASARGLGRPVYICPMGEMKRPLECLLRLQRERLPARLRAFDGGIPQGVLPDLPDHARRTDGERGPATARAASSRHGRPRHPFVQVVWNPQGYGSPDVPGNSAQAYYPGDR